ncbi:MAG: cobyric acid synthase [Pseudomonadota bacterium]
MARALMVQGTGSNVGKSVLVAGLCRAAHRRGLSVAPFKPQNMSNNAAATEDGGEIGRAQALQAQACGRALTVHMNPVLLKPETETGAQVVVQGRRYATARARDYARLKPSLLPFVLESFGHMAAEADLVIVEGAGSPAEVNLRTNDIANMGFAEAADVPVVLAGDIDRGGVIAQIVGTHAVLEPGDARRIAGFLVNKMRGDPRLFDDGYAFIAERTGWPGFGVIPWFGDAHLLPAEDAQGLAATARDAPVRIVCPILSRIANFDDLDPLRQEPSVSLELIPPGRPLPGDADLVILPGAKSTRGDLDFLRREGWDVDIAGHLRRGGRVLGLCGGYQMLGKWIDDPEGIEGPAGRSGGLGLLDVETVMHPEKATRPVGGRHLASGTPVEGYEIHIGRTEGADRARPFLEIGGRAEGAISADGRVAGTYVHGLFQSDAFRSAFLEGLGAAPSALAYGAGIEAVLDRLADHLEEHVDVDALLAAAGPVAAEALGA